MITNSSKLGRRQFLATTAATALASGVLNSRTTFAADGESTKQKICVFTKPFNSLSFDELADKIADLGFDGIEAPIRKGGHVETEAIAEELPKLVEALKKRDLEITLVTSDINDPDDKLTTKFLRTLGTLGIKRYRMKYFHYDFDLPLEAQWEEWQPKLKQLAAMNHEYGVQGLYQNHAGSKYLGASVWDLREVLAGIHPDDLGVAYDIRHATAEGTSTWPVGFRSIEPHLGMVYVKDFAIENEKVVNVPLGEGYVDKEFFKLLAQRSYSDPISLHEEYLDHRDPKLVPEHLAAMKKDLEVLKSWLQ
ncbi:MAG: sugar phosphate isomerase/epimerase family protein [Pirellulaceae bacterium]